ncbi:MAG: hypothetical protein ACRDK7_16195 [Solirubrobacteraceae bacterium]
MRAPTRHDIVIRAFTERPPPPAEVARELARRKRGRTYAERPPGAPVPEWEDVIVVDTETVQVGAEHVLSFAWCRVCAVIYGEAGRFERTCCWKEILVYADELPERDPAGFSLLQQCVSRPSPEDLLRHELDLSYQAERYADTDPEIHTTPMLLPTEPYVRLISRSEFREQIIHQHVYKREAEVVCFNMGFDLSRLAHGWSRTKSQVDGKVSLIMGAYTDESGQVVEDHYRSRILVEPIDGHRNMFSFESRRSPDPDDLDEQGRQWRRGRFTDLSVLDEALCGRRHTLGRACEDAGLPESLQKRDTDGHGVIDREYVLDYARHDARITQALYDHHRRALERYGLDLKPWRVFSPATIAKAAFRRMGLRPLLELDPIFDREVLAACQSAYFGGRSEASLMGSVPVAYYDFLSCYQTVGLLLDWWRFLTAERIVPEDVTDDVRRFLEDVTLDDLEDKRAWSDGFMGALVVAHIGEIDPEHPPVVPVRSDFTEQAGYASIGIQELISPHPGYYALSDLVGSKIRTGQAPRIDHAIGFRPVGRQHVSPIDFHGLRIDPAKGSPFRVTVERRQAIKRKSKSDWTAEDRALEQALKVMGEAGAYGMHNEIRVDEVAESAPVRLDVRSPDERFTEMTSRPEHPVAWFDPMIACQVTAGARLLLMIAEVLVERAGGRVAYMDTDSLAIISTAEGGRVPVGGRLHGHERQYVNVLSRVQVQEVVSWFESLNLYEFGGTILRSEPENDYDYDEQGRRKDEAEDDQTYIHALRPKRYWLYRHTRRLGERGLYEVGVNIRKATEHTLGLRLDPRDPEGPTPGQEDTPHDHPGRHARRRRWAYEFGEWIVLWDALERDVREPDWFARPAPCRVALTRVSEAERLSLRPFGFALSLTVRRGPVKTLLGAWCEAADWTRGARWVHVESGDRYTAVREGELEMGLGNDEIVPYTYGDIAWSWLRAPETTLAMRDGSECPERYRGLLHRRHIEVRDVILQGKEGRYLENIEAGLVEPGEVINRWTKRLRKDELFRDGPLEVLQAHPLSAMTHSPASVPPRTARRIRAGEAMPSARHRQVLERLAVELAVKALHAADRPGTVKRPRAALEAWKNLPAEQQTAEVGPQCGCGCGRPLPEGRRRWYEHACRRRWEGAQRKQRLCEHCGTVLPPRRKRWCNAEHRKLAQEAARTPGLCECGCGERLTGKQHRYKPGHESKARRKRARATVTLPGNSDHPISDN